MADDDVGRTRHGREKLHNYIERERVDVVGVRERKVLLHMLKMLMLTLRCHHHCHHNQRRHNNNLMCHHHIHYAIHISLNLRLLVSTSYVFLYIHRLFLNPTHALVFYDRTTIKFIYYKHKSCISCLITSPINHLFSIFIFLFRNKIFCNINRIDLRIRL